MLSNLVSHKIDDKIELLILDIKDITNSLKELLDKHFVKICEWNSWTAINLVKKELKDYLENKKWQNLEKWTIAEFFVHLFLNELWYKQECLFLNLEERSIKKWFDWYYSSDNEEWIVESKSGSINTANISHENKIKESYDDLKSKISWGSENNPWKNAYNHAKHWDVNTEENIVKRIKSFSDDYINEKYYDVADFNIIPTSTIFLNWTWEEMDKDELKTNLLNKISLFKFKKIKVICITKQTIQLIYNYLEL